MFPCQFSSVTDYLEVASDSADWGLGPTMLPLSKKVMAHVVASHIPSLGLVSFLEQHVEF